MLFPSKNIEKLEQLNDIASLQNEVKEVRLQDKLGLSLLCEKITGTTY